MEFFKKIVFNKFRTRLIAMTVLSGLVPAVIFWFLLNIFGDRFIDKTNRIIQQNQEEQWQRSQAVLKHMTEDVIRRVALTVALNADVYLRNHPTKKVEDLQNDPVFRQITVQLVGKTGYTAIHNSYTGFNILHKNSEMENSDLRNFPSQNSKFWSIIKASLGGKYSKGYYQWVEPNGKIREKFMYVAPIHQKTADQVRMSVAAITYVDEFMHPIKVAQGVFQVTTIYLISAMKQLIISFRNTGFFLMFLGVLVVLPLAYWIGTYFSRGITDLRKATKSVNKGNFNTLIEPVMSGEMAELTEDFNQMVTNLAKTTVSKERLEQSENKLKEVNKSLNQEIIERKRIEIQLRRINRKIERLHEVAQYMQACEAESEIYQMTFEAVKDVLPLSACKLDIVNINHCNDQVLILNVHPVDGKGSCWIKNQLAIKTYQTGKTFLFDHLDDIAGYDQVEVNLKSAISAPIGDIGVFQVFSATRGAFSQNHVRMLELLLRHTVEALKRISLQQKLKEQAIRDALTGAYNRHYFSQAIELEIKRSKRYGYPIRFLMIDINFFKQINDEFGHNIGDLVLQEIGKLLQRQVREVDFVIRYGGDEFLIVLPQTNGRNEVLEARIRAAMADWNKNNHLLNIPVTLAIGSSYWDPKSGQVLEDILELADQRMYADKRSQLNSMRK
ncbi:MAG: diguanylate cyclase [Desulfobacterales bacterium]|nr:diguanylate cyclase [Desulfobacterales bacterium]